MNGKWRTGRVAFIAAVAVLLLSAGAAAVFAAAKTPWIRRALFSRISILAGVVMLFCAVALVGLCGVMWMAGRRRRRPSPQSGVAILEFALVLPFALMLVMIMTQCMFLMTGNMSVHYAAYCGARSAVVAVPMNIFPQEPPNEVYPGDASPKMRMIEDAAVWAVLPVSSSSEELPDGDSAVLQQGLQQLFSRYNKTTPKWARDYLGKKLYYARQYTDVTLAPPAGGGNKYAKDEDLKVTVRHTLYLSVPYADRVFAVLSGGKQLDFGAGDYGIDIVAHCRMPNEGPQDYVDVETWDE